MQKVQPPGSISSNRGASVLLLVMGFGLAILIGQMVLLDRQLAGFRDSNHSQAVAARASFLGMLDDMMSQQITLRNSRFSINSELYRCLTGIPNPCDEQILYEMVLYSPTPPVSYAGGSWPVAPAGITALAGGLTSNKILYNSYGGRCDVLGIVEPSERCPVQAIIQFRPLCGGTLAVPDFSVPGGALCLGPANGFEFMVGIGLLYSQNLIYRKDTTQNGYSRLYRVPASILRN